ncbi:hypothetical protein [Streptomyces sp. NPDC087538]|uniref:hypothetical protein n=1 Tax=Streptomyces sp. NPDC087538 TaxID=3365797 RepID=UPI0038097E51
MLGREVVEGQQLLRIIGDLRDGLGPLDPVGLRERRDDELAEREASWRERALNTEDTLKATQDEVLNQRTQIAELLGQIRDLQTEWTEDDIVRITTENATLKKRVRELEQENRRVTDRPAAARDNVRFADLEAQVIEGGQLSPRETP